jgi:hypothetical protein
MIKLVFCSVMIENYVIVSNHAAVHVFTYGQLNCLQADDVTACARNLRQYGGKLEIMISSLSTIAFTSTFFIYADLINKIFN